MAVISKGIKLYYKVGETDYVELTDLQEIPALGGTAESIEITTLADAAHMYTDGILNYGDSLAFKFLYEAEQFQVVVNLKQSCGWKVELPDGTTCSFSGTCSASLDGVGTNAVITYTLAVKPDSEMIWG
jgi:hypothetical protein